MAGRSERFVRAGYDRPKYMLPLAGGTVFDHAVGSFSRCFASTPFVLVVREEARAFAAARSRALGIRDARVVALDADTAGQAETVALGIERAACPADAPLTIFNIDTFRPDFSHPDEAWFAASEGYLEVFAGEGANWSYVRLDPASATPRVAETAEKRPISNLCCTGLYHFTRQADFLAALARERLAASAAELYVAPLYNHLIAMGARIHYRRIEADAVRFCGVPTEYEALRRAEGALTWTGGRGSIAPNQRARTT